jgi:hypothetical protein
MTNSANYKKLYKSIQLNVSKQKYNDLLMWLGSCAKNEERSLNYIIVKILSNEFEKCRDKEIEEKET